MEVPLLFEGQVTSEHGVSTLQSVPLQESEGLPLSPAAQTAVQVEFSVREAQLEAEIRGDENEDGQSDNA